MLTTEHDSDGHSPPRNLSTAPTGQAGATWVVSISNRSLEVRSSAVHSAASIDSFTRVGFLVNSIYIDAAHSSSPAFSASRRNWVPVHVMSALNSSCKSNNGIPITMPAKTVTLCKQGVCPGNGCAPTEKLQVKRKYHVVGDPGRTKSPNRAERLDAVGHRPSYGCRMGFPVTRHPLGADCCARSVGSG
jgi:hypothetical protein